MEDNTQKNLWGGRFQGEADAGFAEFNRSFGFDRRLFEADVRASLAHCDGLAGAGVLAPDEAQQLRSALAEILESARRHPGYLDEIPAEDVHSFVEARLVEMVGDVGRKLHTGRSRNDQVATDFRLWLRDQIDLARAEITLAQTALLDLAETNSTIVIPGYTHLQRAQPVLLAHWCLAYFEMLDRDRDRLKDVRKRLNVLPLGSAALAGTSYAIDREAVAHALGFDSVSRNSLDAVSDRDFCIEFASAASLVMMHLSRLAEDIILYVTIEFGFFELSDAVATGSSLMPQKKNPDSMELVRGKAGRVFGHLAGLLATMKGLPLAYNKDMQEDKEAIFDTVDTVLDCLKVTATVLRNLRVNKSQAEAAASRGYLNATELADYLVRKGVPFRQAHEMVGRVVMKSLAQRCELNELSLDELKSFSPLIEDDVFDALGLEATLASKSQVGGTAPERVRTALSEARKRLAADSGGENTESP
ncbi:MAG TPA: argininosuccinate lyase [Pyrinomonadaceae bacterium]|jgi:argininosuccinate lyase|nr:argininosuccinate lyase [Pyrinomonadaceae bacterium]